MGERSLVVVTPDKFEGQTCPLCDSQQWRLSVSQGNQPQELSGENPATLVRVTLPAGCPGNQVSTAGEALHSQLDVRVQRGGGQDGKWLVPGMGSGTPQGTRAQTVE